MPVWRLLRVHSTAPAGSMVGEAREQLLEHHPHLQPGQAGAQAEVQRRARTPRCGFGSRRMSNAHRVGEDRARRGWPTPPRTATLSPGSMVWPPSSASRVAVRRFDGDGVVHRSISSIAVRHQRRGRRASARQLVGIARPARAPRPRSRCGWSRCPAANSRLKNMYSSSSVSSGGSSSASDACTTTDSMSSVGSGALRGDQRAAVLDIVSKAARFASRCRVAGRGSRSRVRPRRTAGGGPPRGRRAGCRSSASAARPRRRRGSRPVRRRAPRRAARRSGGGARPPGGAIVRGVRPLLTSRRIRAWRGSSIMLSTTPATGRSWSSVPP